MQGYQSNGRQLRGLRILVVDDCPDYLELAERHLRFHGAIVCCAESGPKALEALKYQEFDIVLLDLAMPGMDGCEVAARARDLGFHKPIVLVTADSFFIKNNQFACLGFSWFVVKPYASQDLVETILMLTQNEDHCQTFLTVPQ